MRKGMRSSKQARHAARNVRANAARTLDLLAANLRCALSALLAFAMVVAVAIPTLVGTTAYAGAKTADGCTKLESSDIASGDLTITATTRNANGDLETKTYKNPSEITDIALNSETTFKLQLSISDETIKGGATSAEDYNLDLCYPLSLDYESISDESKEIQHVTKNGELLGTMQIVRGEDGKAQLRCVFNSDYVKKHGLTQGFWINYTFKSKWDDGAVPSGSESTWEFPGIQSDIDVTWSKPQVTGGKSCYYTNGLSQKCTVHLTAEADVDNFDFKDVHGSGLTVNRDFSITSDDSNNQAAVDAANGAQFNYGSNDSDRTVSLHMDRLPKGSYTIEYTSTVKDNLGVDSNGKYEGAQNTAQWTWNGGGPKESTYEAWAKGKSYNWIYKSSPNAPDSDGDIEWTVTLNSGEDKADLGNYKFTDALQQVNGQPTQSYTGNLTIYKVVKNADGSETTTKVSDDTTLPTDKQSFDYTFGSDAGAYEYRLVYHTKPSDTASVCQNKGTISAPKDDGSYEEKGSSDATYRKDISNVSVLKKSQQGDAEEVSGHPGVLEVPWTIEFDPQGQDITELNFYEDWITSDSDGNTQHMWYSKDHLNLKVEELSDDGTTWTDVTNNYQIFSRDGRDLPSGTDYPTGWYHNGGHESGDNYSNHDGSPSFKLWYSNDDDRSTKRYNHKMRITYTTLFDKTPDVYRNYAKFSYKVGGQEKGETVDATYTYSGGNHVGKSADAVHEGSSEYTDAATFETADTVKTDYMNALKAEGMSDNDAEAKAVEYVQQHCPNGRWRVHWRVWGNGVKSWWNKYDTTNALNGIESLKSVANISMTDSLPNGWKIADDKPVYGRFVNQNFDAFDNDNGKTDEHWDNFKIAANADCGTNNGDTCATYTQSNQNLVFKVPNNGTLTGWRTDPNNSSSDVPATKTGSTVPKQDRSIVVFGFDTYITPETANDLGYKAGTTMVFTNRANMAFDGTDLVSSNASGTTSIKQDVENVLNKWGNVDSSKNLITYEISVQPDVINFIGSSDSYQLIDELDTPNAEYVPGTFKANVGGDDNRDISKYITTEISIDSKTRKQSVIFTIPKEIKYTAFNNSYSTKGENIRLKYSVRVKGVVGQNVKVTNTVKLKGNEAVKKTDSRDTTIQDADVAMGAKGTTFLTKTNNDMQNQLSLSGATFTVCKVNTSDNATNTADHATCDASFTKQMETDENGRISFTMSSGNDTGSALHGLETSTLYVAIETQAPSGYQLDAAPYYFYLRDTNDADASSDKEKLAAMKAYVEQHGLTVESNDDLTVRDHEVDTLSWSKADLSKVTFSNGKGTITDGAYLSGSKWAVCTKDCNTDQANYLYVTDNGTAGGSAGTTWTADEDSRAGYIKISGVKRNTTYWVKEISAPNGYQTNGDIRYAFTVQSDGTTAVSGYQKGTDTKVTNSDIDFAQKAWDNGLVQLADGSWVITNKHGLLTTMPFTGRFGGVGMWLAMGLALGVSSFGLFMSTGKERRPRASHSRV